jgi:hypothetical protein
MPFGAGDDRDRAGGMNISLAKKVHKELGILAFSFSNMPWLIRGRWDGAHALILCTCGWPI